MLAVTNSSAPGYFRRREVRVVCRTINFVPPSCPCSSPSSPFTLFHVFFSSGQCTWHTAPALLSPTDRRFNASSRNFALPSAKSKERELQSATTILCYVLLMTPRTELCLNYASPSLDAQIKKILLSLIVISVDVLTYFIKENNQLRGFIDLVN